MFQPPVIQSLCRLPRFFNIGEDSKRRGTGSGHTRVQGTEHLQRAQRLANFGPFPDHDTFEIVVQVIPRRPG